MTDRRYRNFEGSLAQLIKTEMPQPSESVAWKIAKKLGPSLWVEMQPEEDERKEG